MASRKRFKYEIPRINDYYMCPVCLTVSTKKYNIERHIDTIHDGDISDVCQSPPPPCDIPLNNYTAPNGNSDNGAVIFYDCLDSSVLPASTSSSPQNNNHDHDDNDAYNDHKEGNFHHRQDPEDDCAAELQNQIDGETDCSYLMDSKDLFDKMREAMLASGPTDSDSDSSSTLSDVTDDDSCKSGTSDSDLSDFEDDWIFDKSPTHSRLTKKDHAAIMLGLTLRHNLSNECLKDILYVLKLHLPELNQSFLNHFKIKTTVSGMDSKLKFIEYCEKCFALLPDDENVYNCPNNSCNGYKGNPTRKIKKCFILTCCLKDQLKAILERPGMWDKILRKIGSRNSSNAGSITDVTDGKRYKKLLEPGGVLHGTEDLTLIFNTDGVALYKSSRIEIWPVYISINEIPPKERFQCKNVALWGLWQGKGKPPTYAFLKPLVEALTELAIDGLILNSGKRIKFYSLISTMDLIAKAQMLCMNQHNGYHGCSTCLIRGKHENRVQTYPYSEAIQQEKRTDEGTFKDAVKAISTPAGQKVNGIKGPSSLLLIPEFSITFGVVPDYMHGVLLGVTKMLITCWFDPSEHKAFYKENKTYPDYYIGHLIKDVDARLEDMKPVDCISRRPRPLSGNLGHLKANELRAWLLFYSLPCLESILPPLYWNHFALLVEATHILLSEEIKNKDLEWAKYCMNLFYKYFCEFYEERKCGLNVHNLIHLHLYVEYWGPLWAWSCFGFESLNGVIIKQVHGTKNGSVQIFKTFNALKTIHIMMHSKNTKEIVRNTLASMLMKSRRNTSSWSDVNNECCVGGKGVKFDKKEQENLKLNSGTIKYLQLKKNGIYYSSVQYKRAVKTVNYYAMCIRDGKEIIVKIHYFILDKDEVFFSGQEVQRKHEWQIIPEWDRSCVVRIEPNEKAPLFIASSMLLSEKLFLMDGNLDFICVCRVPNVVEGD